MVDTIRSIHFFDYDADKKETYAQIKTPSGMIKDIWNKEDGETTQIDINRRTVTRKGGKIYS